MYLEYPWMLGPFHKAEEANPCLVPNEKSSFFCPVRQQHVAWEAKDVFNPAAVVRDGKVWLLYRAEDHLGKYAGTSRIGLAVSEDGLHFSTCPEPVLFPDEDGFQSFEWEGGCEDPRIVETEEGKYYLYYTSFNGRTALLCCAESTDLIHWKKHGPILRDALNGKYAGLWSKSGAVVCRQDGEHFYPVKLQGTYWMYWGESNIYAAVSEDLIHWTPVEFIADGSDPSHTYSPGRTNYSSETADGNTSGNSVLLPVIVPRKGNYDEYLCEPGPQALLTDAGIVLLYNGKGRNPEHLGGHDTMYQGGQLLLDPENPVCVIARTRKPFISPSESFELEGQVMPTCFLEGLVSFHGQYFLYYGTADSKVAVSVFQPDKEKGFL